MWFFTHSCFMRSNIKNKIEYNNTLSSFLHVYSLINFQFPPWLVKYDVNNPKILDWEEESLNIKRTRYRINLQVDYYKNNSCPSYFIECITYLEKHVSINIYSLEDTEGIFRKSGSVRVINRLQYDLLFNNAKIDSLDYKFDAYDVGSVLKYFIRKLSVPLVPSSYYHDIINSNPPDRTELWKTILIHLSPAHIELLKQLFKLFKLTAVNSEINKMTCIYYYILAENIGSIVTMSGNIIQSGDLIGDLKEFSPIAQFIQHAIDNYEVLFESEEHSMMRIRKPTRENVKGLRFNIEDIQNNSELSKISEISNKDLSVSTTSESERKEIRFTPDILNTVQKTVVKTSLNT